MCSTDDFLDDVPVVSADRTACSNGIIMLSVCLSVCFAVHSGTQSRCTGLKVVYRHVPSRQLPINLFSHFCCSIYRWATKHSEKM